MYYDLTKKKVTQFYVIFPIYSKIEASLSIQLLGSRNWMNDEKFQCNRLISSKYYQ